MRNYKMWIVPSAAMLLAAGLWGAGCGGDDATPATPGAGGSGGGGGGGGGSDAGAKGGGDSGTKAETGAKDLPNDYSGLTNCPGVTSAPVDMTLAACNTLCGGGHCVPAANGDPAGTYKMCPGGTNICLPDKVIASGGKFVGKACMVLGGSLGPGVCLPACILPPSADPLTAGADGCGMSEKCVPCDYMDASTGACTNRCGGTPEGGTEAGEAGDATTTDAPAETTTEASTDAPVEAASDATGQ
jgi:hypothetical protein